jgi:hypothetical protein
MKDNTPTVEQMNEVIGIFMGGMWKDVNIGGNPYKRFYMPLKSGWDYVKSTFSLDYHRSWDELIPVIKQIKAMHLDILKQAYILDYMKAAAEMNRGLVSLDIEKAHAGVYKFLQWYNQNKNQ